MPVLSFLVRAFTVQTVIQWGSSHCIHTMGTSMPTSSKNCTEIAESFGLNVSFLVNEHTSSQVLQPVHFSGEITIPLAILTSGHPLSGARITSFFYLYIKEQQYC